MVDTFARNICKEENERKEEHEDGRYMTPLILGPLVATHLTRQDKTIFKLGTVRHSFFDFGIHEGGSVFGNGADGRGMGSSM
jgi:hypothetical protein